MIQISILSALPDVKAIHFPSGDQLGNISEAGLWVTCLAVPPEAGMIQISEFPPFSDSKAIHFPSGDQLVMLPPFASKDTESSSEVIRLASPPDAGMVQTSPAPPLSDVKASVVPSGDQIA